MQPQQIQQQEPDAAAAAAAAAGPARKATAATAAATAEDAQPAAIPTKHEFLVKLAGALGDQLMQPDMRADVKAGRVLMESTLKPLLQQGEVAGSEERELLGAELLELWFCCCFSPEMRAVAEGGGGLRECRRLELEGVAMTFTPRTARLHMTPSDVTYKFYRTDCPKPEGWRFAGDPSLFPQTALRRKAEECIGTYVALSLTCDAPADSNGRVRAFEAAQRALQSMYGISIYFSRHMLRWAGWVCRFEDPLPWCVPCPQTHTRTLLPTAAR